MSKHPHSSSSSNLPAGLDRPEIADRAVVAAIGRVPRERFIPGETSSEAYADRAVSIGFNQTISQPYIVALMTQEGRVKTGMKVLEIGTGSGYQAAVLRELGASVFSVEIVPELAERARKTLGELGYSDIVLRVGDGWGGWPEEAPFDLILVTAAAPQLPTNLLRQLKEGGRLIAPMECPDRSGEQLMVYERHGDELTQRKIGNVRFVPLTGAGREGF